MRNINEILIDKNITIKEAMKVIDKGAIKTAIIVDEKNKLCGVLTDGDIRRGILDGLDVSEKVLTVMNKNPIYSNIDTPKKELLRIMKMKQINCLPLLDDDEVLKDLILLSSGIDLTYFNLTAKSKTQLSRILIIGGAGFIGSILVRKLLSKNYKVNVLDNFTYGCESLKEIESNPNLKIIKGDTRHIEDIIAAIKDVDAVVHLAELVGDPVCSVNPTATQEINYIATMIVAGICKHFQINRLIYASSCSVYGASEKDKLLTEDSPLNPVSLYAKMKISSENALVGMKDDNFQPTILRLSTVFGFSYRPRFDLVINLLTAKAIEDKKITIFGGNQWRPNIHVSDVADTISLVLESPIEKVGGQIFNVGCEENNSTIIRVGELIKKVVPSAELIIEEKNIDERDYKIDFNKIKNTLNINMKYKIIDGINEIKEAFEKKIIENYKERKYNNYLFLKNKNNGGKQND